MKTELEKRAIKFIDETDTMQFTTMELLTMFAEKEQALQLLQTDVSISNYIDESPHTKTFRTKKEDYTDRGFYRK